MARSTDDLRTDDDPALPAEPPDGTASSTGDLRTGDETLPVEPPGDAADGARRDVGSTGSGAAGEPPNTEDDGDDELEEVPRRGRTALAISLVVALVLSGFVGVLATRGPAGGDDQAVDFSVAGDEAFDLSGATLDGGDFDMGAYTDRWVVVNFFATWCMPCRREHPELVQFDEAHRPLEDAVLVSVLYDDDPDTAAEYFETNGGEWPVVLDRDGEIAVNYGVTGVPETYLVAPGGRLYVRLTGGVTQDILDQLITDAQRQLDEAQQQTQEQQQQEQQP